MSTARIRINLASEPFRRDRPILAASAVTAVLLLVVLGFLVSNILSEREAASESREMLARLERQLAGLNSQIAQQEAELQRIRLDIIQSARRAESAEQFKKYVEETRKRRDAEREARKNQKIKPDSVKAIP